MLAKIGENVAGKRWAGMAEAVGGRRGCQNISSGSAPGHRVRRHTHRDCRPSGGHQTGDLLAFGKIRVSGPGQKASASRHATREISAAARGSQEASARWTISGSFGAAFCLKDARNGASIESIGAEPI